MKHIQLTNGGVACVDDRDYQKLNKHRWVSHPSGGILYASRYIYSAGKQIEIKMHREILGLQRYDGTIVDHRNRDGLDNTRANLRVVTRNINAQNSKLRSDNSSGFRGVYKNGKGYMAQTRISGKLIYLGTYKSAIEAAHAYDCKILAVYGACAARNFNEAPKTQNKTYAGREVGVL